MDILLTDLPQVCLEEIFKNLSYAEISRLGSVCKYFREVSKTIFRLYFKHQENIIEKEMEKIESEAAKSDKLTVDDHLHMALLHSILRILLSEAKMLKAHCWRYMRDPLYDFCFPAGIILDEFERILETIRDKSLNKDMEPEITTTLFHLGETFYDYFDTKIENHFHETSKLQIKIVAETNRHSFLPKIYSFASNTTKETLLREIHRYIKKNQLYEDEQEKLMQESSMKKSEILEKNGEAGENITKTLFGVKILDILDCCATSDYHSLLSHSSRKFGFKINTEYELRDINVLEALPSIGLSYSTPERQLNKICRYIRNNVRWTNLFHPLQDLWMLEDAIEIKRDIDTASALLQQWRAQRTLSRLTLERPAQEVYQYDYRRIISRFKNRFGLLITAALECPNIEDVPLKMEECLTSNAFHVNNVYQFMATNKRDVLLDEINLNNWNAEVKTYKFHLELKIQYPSFLSDTIREAIMKVDQEGEETTVTTDIDNMEKSASLRADEMDQFP